MNKKEGNVSIAEKSWRQSQGKGQRDIEAVSQMASWTNCKVVGFEDE